MSLIQEALRRQQEDMQANQAAAGPRPPTPLPSATAPPPIQQKMPPLPEDPKPEVEPPPVAEPPPIETDRQPEDTGQEDELTPATDQPKASSSRNLIVAMAVIMVTLGLLGAGAYAVYYAFASSTSEPGQPPPAVTEPVAAAPVEAPPEPPVETVAEIPPETKPEPKRPPVALPPPLPPPPPPVVVKPPAIWPSLTINGLVGKDKQGSAMINNQIVAVDETIENVRVVSIGIQGVTLEYQGETRFVKVHGSTQ